MSWSREEVTMLIDEYRKWPNLYKVKSPNYKNRNLRRRALESILSAFKDVKPAVTIQEVQTKFQALKQNASKERKKCLESQKSGAGVDDLVEPSLWYYKLLSYIFDDADPRPATDPLDVEPDEIQLTVIEEDDDNPDAEEIIAGVVSPAGTIVEEIIELPNVENTPSTSASASSTSVAPQKRKRKANDDRILGDLSVTLQSISRQLVHPNETHLVQKSANQCFGDYIVSKLDRIDVVEIRDEVEADIISIVTKALNKCQGRKQ